MKKLFLISFAVIVIVFVGFLVYRVSMNPLGYLPVDEVKAAQKEPEFNHWREFKSPDGKFKVCLPYLPQHAKEVVNDQKTEKKRTYNMYIAEKPDGSIFMVNEITFHGETVLEKDKLMRKMMNDLIASDPSNVLNSVQKGRYKGHESLDFSFENPSMIVEAKAFMENNTLFMLSHVSRAGNGKEYDFFVNSFELQKSE